MQDSIDQANRGKMIDYDTWRRDRKRRVKEEFDAAIQLGVDDMLAGRVLTFEELKASCDERKARYVKMLSENKN